MQQQYIYELEICAIGQMAKLMDQKPVVTCFSNLRKCIDTLLKVMALQAWEHSINYTAAYRAIQLKERYSYEVALQGSKMFRVNIVRKIINPSLTLLGIEANPLYQKI
jgi:hypothetical protein